MSRQLPSFPSLRAFEAAARHLSFKAAAEELCLTQSAISHQIKVLEEFLGAPLFIRHPQRVELTLRGSEYLEMISFLLDGIESATQKIKGDEIKGPLYVQSSPAFASFWLLPRIVRFNRMYPEIELNLSTIAETESYVSHPFDVRINCSWEVPPDTGAEPFMISSRIPVCNPELLKNGPPISEPEDLLSYPIIREEESWDKWDQWFSFAGYKETPKLVGPHFDNAYLAIKAAEEGLGIALGTIALIHEKVALGRLVVLIEPKTQPKCYYTINYAMNWKRQPKVVAFRDWMYKELESCSQLESSIEKTGTMAI